MPLPRSILATLTSFLLAGSALAQVLHVDPESGDDANPGGASAPLATLPRAAEIANAGTGGPTIIRLSPGVHVLERSPLFEREAPYDPFDRLVIEAVHNPDDEGWHPGLMPVLVSVEPPHMDGVLCAYGLRIEVSHATVRGLKFLGNPWSGTFYYAIWRGGLDLEDLEVTQCLFQGDRDVLPIHLSVIANGSGLRVDHSIFSGCKNSVVFWDGPDGESTGNAMTHCIVDGAYASAVWTCSTAADFEFHHNVLTRSRYAWVREHESRRGYSMEDCVVVENEWLAGYGGGPQAGFETTDSDFLEVGERVITEGRIVFSGDATSREYLHVVHGTLGSDLGAGLFLLDSP